jgi:hypothetical protein
MEATATNLLQCTCECCGAVFPKKRASAIGRFCSRNCKVAGTTLYPRNKSPCPTCGKLFKRKGRRPVRYCSFKCRSLGESPKDLTDRSTLVALYADHTADEIAARIGRSRRVVEKWLHRHGIPQRDGGRGKSKNCRRILPGSKPPFTGADHPMWKGGVTPERQAFSSLGAWKQAAKAVWKRDKATCQRCARVKAASDGPLDFQVHHIVSFAYAPLRTDISNLILLCIDCHHWVHSNANVSREFIKDVPGEA